MHPSKNTRVKRNRTTEDGLVASDGDVIAPSALQKKKVVPPAKRRRLSVDATPSWPSRIHDGIDGLKSSPLHAGPNETRFHCIFPAQPAPNLRHTCTIAPAIAAKLANPNHGNKYVDKEVLQRAIRARNERRICQRYWRRVRRIATVIDASVEDWENAITVTTGGPVEFCGKIPCWKEDEHYDRTGPGVWQIMAKMRMGCDSVRRAILLL